MKTFYDAMTRIDLLWKRIFMQFNFPSLRNSQDPQGKENQSKIAFCLLQVGHMSAFTIVWWNWFELKYIDLQTNWNFCTHHLFNRPVIQQSLMNISWGLSVLWWTLLASWEARAANQLISSRPLDHQILSDIKRIRLIDHWLSWGLLISSRPPDNHLNCSYCFIWGRNEKWS